MLRRRPRDERGTLALAMVVLMVCAATAGLLVARNVSAAHDTVDARHRAQALAAADAGLAEIQALHALGDLATPTLTGTVGDASWSATASPGGTDSLEITSTGRRAGWSGTVAATVTKVGNQVQVTDWHQVSGGPTG